MLYFLYNNKINLDQDWNNNDEFWKEFGGKESVKWIKAPCAAGNDENYWRENRDIITLHKLYFFCFK